MKAFLPPLGLLLTSALALAQAPAPPIQPAPPTPLPWSVTGNWFAKHPAWDDTLSIQADGSFIRSDGDGGKWRLIIKDDHPALEMTWEGWKPEILSMITQNLFRGPMRNGVLELRRIAPGVPVPPPPKASAEPAKEFDAPKLKALLQDSVWRLRDGKQFTLHADGTTSGSWHSRKGFWRIIGPNQVQLTIAFADRPPATVTVEGSTATHLRWPDEDWGVLAKRLAAGPGEP